ncbi:MAG: LacI family transcriptional regulator [Acholeplasmataceae bacterium]|nr:LacI family transcriptional regulator [Acholeplasmataceae bacterium]
MSATIKDVAKLAGVSISTASCALNEKGNVSDQLKDKIFKAAKKLNYHPNAAAKQLKTKKTDNIGVFIYGFSGPVFSEVLEGMNKAAQEEGYNLLVSSGSLSEKIINQRQIDGAIIFDSHIKDEVLINYSLSNYPVILLDRDLEGDNISRSIINNQEIVYNFILQMQKKYQKIAMITGPNDSYNALGRLEGYKEALKTKNLQPIIYKGDFTYESGIAIGQKLTKEDLPDLMFCANDETAIGLMEEMKKQGYKIPEDMAICGFDNILWTRHVEPQLTTIAINHTEWGHDVAKSLINYLKTSKFLEIGDPKHEVIYRASA